MTKNTISLIIVLIIGLTAINSHAATDPRQALLGKQLFFDVSLSSPAGQSCAGCHIPEQGFADADAIVSAGANPALHGNRNAPAISYAAYTVDWHYNSEDQTWMGGFFLDGRAKTLVEQAKEPFLNPLEMANPSIAVLIDKIKKAPYAKQLESLYGKAIWSDTNQAFTAVAQAIAAYEKSDLLNGRFSSKYDAYLRDEVRLTQQEMRGLKLYEAQDKGNCAACHPSQPADNGTPPLFTDFSYDNLGVPKNPKLPFYHAPAAFNPAGADYIDLGLALNPHIEQTVNGGKTQAGKFKVPTLRNIALTAPYMHNGALATLRGSVEFYNSRDSDKKWGPPEVKANVNRDELGDLKLSEQEIDDIVAFLKTLTDGWQAVNQVAVRTSAPLEPVR